ncbi:MAG: hypothetical protein HKN27_14735 [Silicimonas sp.]|nr:hypothetical protein [Silicimonas sp.]
MGGPYIWGILIALLLVIPFWRILPRHGLSKYLAVLAVIPIFAIALLWIIAFRDEIEGFGK